MNDLPHVVEVRVNAGPGVMGSFIDPEWVLHYVAAGHWLFQADGRHYRVKPGDMVLIPPRILHVVQPTSNGRLVQRVVHFELRELALPADVARVISLPTALQKQVARIFQELRQEWISPNAYRSTVVGGILATLIGLYLRYSDRSEKGEIVHTPGWPSVENAVRHMQRHFRDPALALPQISRAAGVSPNYLCRIFKENTGGSVMRYLTEIRMQQAAELLVRSTDNCTQVAEAVGFAGIHVFSRTFKKRYRLSPTTFRARHAPQLFA